MCTTTWEVACVPEPAVFARSCTQLVTRAEGQDAFRSSTACPPPHLQDQPCGGREGCPGAAEECMMYVALGVSLAFFPGEDLISKSPGAAKVLGHACVTPQTLYYVSVSSGRP